MSDRGRVVKQFVQGHTAEKWKGWDWKPGSAALEPDPGCLAGAGEPSKVLEQGVPPWAQCRRRMGVGVRPGWDAESTAGTPGAWPVRGTWWGVDLAYL